MSPNEAILPENAINLSEQVYEKIRENKKQVATIKTGDFVRLNLLLGPFAKTYEARWSRALFKVVKGPYYTTSGFRPMYRIMGAFNKKAVDGGFYESELKFVDPDVFVKKYIFPNSFNLMSSQSTQNRTLRKLA